MDRMLTVTDIANAMQMGRNAAQKLITTKMRYIDLNEGGKNRTIRVPESEFMNFCRANAVQGAEIVPKKVGRPKKKRDFPTYEEAQAMHSGRTAAEVV